MEVVSRENITIVLAVVGAALGVANSVYALVDRSRRRGRARADERYRRWLSGREAHLRQKRDAYEKIKSAEGQQTADLSAPFLVAGEDELDNVVRAARENRLQWWGEPGRKYGLS